ncbi:MAG: histidine--tRNA ligase [Dehalococcoidales bacterium]
MYQAPRGTSDILPEEQVYWRFVEQKAAQAGLLYGYQRIDTPMFEDTTLFTRTTGEFTDIVQKEMYTFDDRGGNNLTLKPEGTPPVCRAYLQHGMFNLPQPVKLYYISPIFRYDRPQAGRYRQHHQFGCEAIGLDDPTLDAEVIDLAWQFYRSLNLRHLSLQLNSIGCKKCRPDYLAALTSYYAPHIEELCSDCKVRLIKNPLRLLDCKKPSCRPVADSAPQNIDYLCRECAEHFSQLKKYLGLLDIPFKVNHSLVRGLDYYTRTVFEIQPEAGGSQSSLGGGGRYDGLIEELGGKPTPAVGFGLGIERMILNLKEQKTAIPPEIKPQVFIAHMGDEAGDEAIKLAAELRRAGIAVIEAIGGRSLKAQLRQANTLAVPQVVIIGDEEVKTGTVILRDMADARQVTVPLAQLQKLLK